MTRPAAVASPVRSVWESSTGSWPLALACAAIASSAAELPTTNGSSTCANDRLPDFGVSGIAPDWELSIALHDLAVDEKDDFTRGYGLTPDEFSEVRSLPPLK